METLLKIDRFLATSKSVVGRPEWKVQASGLKAVLVATLSVDGVVQGGFELRAHALVQQWDQKGTILILYDSVCIQRLNFISKSSHANPGGDHVPEQLRYVRFPKGDVRMYRWVNDRNWPVVLPKGVNIAQSVTELMSNFDEAATYFCEISNIAGKLPSPPCEPRLL